MSEDPATQRYELPPRAPQGWPPPAWPPPAQPPLPPGPPPPRRGSRLLRSFVVLVAVVGLVAAGWWLRTGEAPPVPQVGRPVATAEPAPRTVPTPGNEESDAPLGTPPPAPDSDVYAFVARQDDGTPVAYDPCRPVAVVLSPDGAPADAEPLLVDALARMTEVTGLQFRYEGTTDELPGGDRAAYQPDRYGDRWAPVLVGWRTPDQEPGLAGDVAGLGGSASAGPEGGPLAWVTGSVTLDGPEFAELAAGGDAEVGRAILLHELGHVVGLAHVWDSDQLMASTTTGEVLDFADGDLAGLAQLGAGVCIPEL